MQTFSQTFTVTPLVLACTAAVVILLMVGWYYIREKRYATASIIIALAIATLGPVFWLGAETSWRIVFLSGVWVIALVVLLVGVFLTIRPRKA
jgi:hypothetical protein